MVRLALTRTYRNSTQRQAALQEALRGYGMGVANISSAASTQAAQEYGQQFAVEATKAGAEYQANVNAHFASYRSIWDNYLKMVQATTTSTTTTGMLDPDTGVVRINRVV